MRASLAGRLLHRGRKLLTYRLQFTLDLMRPQGMVINPFFWGVPNADQASLCYYHIVKYLYVYIQLHNIYFFRKQTSHH